MQTSQPNTGEPSTVPSAQSNPPQQPASKTPVQHCQYYTSNHVPALQNMSDLDGLDGAKLDEAVLQRIRVAVKHTANVIKQRLGDSPSTAINVLRLMWTNDVFSKLSTDFQLRDSGLAEKPTEEKWARFLSVLLKAGFYNCASFDELYQLVTEYGDINQLLPIETFVAMKKGLSAAPSEIISGDDINSVNGWEELLTKITSPFIHPGCAVMIDDDHFDSQAERTRSGPLLLADAACSAYLKFITAVSVRREVSDMFSSSVLRVLDRLKTNDRKPDWICCERGYASFPVPVIERLKAENIHVFDTARTGLEHQRSDTPDPFNVDGKDGVSRFLQRVFNMPNDDSNHTALQSRQMKYIDTSRSNNLSLSQMITMRFLNYLVYNAYVVHRVLAVYDIVDETHHSCTTTCTDKHCASAVLHLLHKEWNTVSLRRFVADINRSIATDGPTCLLFQRLSLHASVSVVVVPHRTHDTSQSDNVDQAAQLERHHTKLSSCVLRKPWPKRHRKKYADIEPWKSQRLCTDLVHDVQHLHKPRACVLCTDFERGKPAANSKRRQTSFGCTGCDGIPLCVRPERDGSRTRSCFSKWHANQLVG